jgi:hypothetical protein
MLNLSQAARLLGSNHDDKPVAPSTLTRWILSGVKLRGGGRLRLRALKLPGGWRIRPGDLDEFIERLTADRLADAGHHQGDDAPARPTRTPSQARRSHERAVKHLKAAGF